jgi:hydrogenase maturation protease
MGANGGRVLVAGIGNVFLGDDGFGVEVVRLLSMEPVSEAVRLKDFGIRGVHLGYALLDESYEDVLLVDIMVRGGEPGTLYLVEIDELPESRSAAAPDPHRMDLRAVLSWVRAHGGELGRVRLVGCEPLSNEEELGLSPPVERGAREAAHWIRELLEEVIESHRRERDVIT